MGVEGAGARAFFGWDIAQWKGVRYLEAKRRSTEMRESSLRLSIGVLCCCFGKQNQHTCAIPGVDSSRVIHFVKGHP